MKKSTFTSNYHNSKPFKIHSKDPRDFCGRWMKVWDTKVTTYYKSRVLALYLRYRYVVTVGKYWLVMVTTIMHSNNLFHHNFVPCKHCMDLNQLTLYTINTNLAKCLHPSCIMFPVLQSFEKMSYNCSCYLS